MLGIQLLGLFFVVRSLSGQQFLLIRRRFDLQMDLFLSSLLFLVQVSGFQCSSAEMEMMRLDPIKMRIEDELLEEKWLGMPHCFFLMEVVVVA